MEDWAEIRRLHRAEQMPIKAIARRLRISRNAVRRALAKDSPPRYERPGKGSLWGPTRWRDHPRILLRRPLHRGEESRGWGSR